MQRFLPVWVGWLMLTTIFLWETAPCFAKGLFPLRSSPTVSAFAWTDLNSDAVVVVEPSCSSRQLSRLCQQEHRQHYALTSAVDSLLQSCEGMDRWLTVQRVAPLRVRFFFPRKLSPPAAEDDYAELTLDTAYL